jgi:hypothetical protein
MVSKVNVRVAVAVGQNGEWYAVGSSKSNDDNTMALAAENIAYGELRYWLTASLKLPEVKVVKANVENVDGQE